MRAEAPVRGSGGGGGGGGGAYDAALRLTVHRDASVCVAVAKETDGGGRNRGGTEAVGVGGRWSVPVRGPRIGSSRHRRQQQSNAPSPVHRVRLTDVRRTPLPWCCYDCCLPRLFYTAPSTATLHWPSYTLTRWVRPDVRRA